MIPKTIHYCWFGRGEKPDKVKNFIETWHASLPDYEIKEWNEDNFDVNICAFSKEAYIMKDYAFVSDVCRLKVLFEHGGIYLDTDVEVIKPFDPFLHHSSFCGYEARQYVGTGIIGAEKGCGWIGMFLDFYMKRHFINITGHPVRTSNAKLLALKIMPAVPENVRPTMYPIDYFSGKNWVTGEFLKTDNTVCIHHYHSSWNRKKKTLLMRIRIIVKGLKARYFMKSRRI